MPKRVNFSSTVFISCEVSEMKKGADKLAISKGINLLEMTKDDTSPLYTAVNLVKENSIGKGTIGGQSIDKKYMPRFVKQVAEAISSPKSNSDSVKLYPGHQKPSDVGYELREHQGVFVGGLMESSGWAVGHLYVLPRATNLRDDVSRGIYPKVSIEAVAEMQYNPDEKIIEVVNLVQLKGVAIANDADVGIEGSGFTKVLQEMGAFEETKIEGREVKPHMTLAEIQEMLKTVTIDQLREMRPDLVGTISEEVLAENDAQASIEEMKKSSEIQAKALADKDKTILEMKAEKEAKEAEIAEMQKKSALKEKKAELTSGLKYSADVIEMINQDLDKAQTVEEMTATVDTWSKRLEKLGVKPQTGQKKVAEVKEMRGVVEGDILEMGENRAPKLSKQEAMQLKFGCESKSFTEKYKIFAGNLYEMKNFYSKNGEDEIKSLLTMDLSEMQTRSDFPDLLEYGLDPLLIDAYFAEAQNTMFANFFTPFDMTRNDIPFPSLKGFQVGRIVEGEPYPLVSLKAGARTVVTAEDWGLLLNISHAMIRDSQVDAMKYNVQQIGRAHAMTKDQVACYLLGAAGANVYGTVTNTVGNLRGARRAGRELFESGTGIPRPRFYNAVILSPARAEELLPATTTTFFQGVAVDPNTGDVKAVAGMKVYEWIYMPDNFSLLACAKGPGMLQCIREGLNIANAEDFKTNSEQVRSNEAFTFAALDGTQIMKINFS